jgi:hypothetical protein
LGSSFSPWCCTLFWFSICVYKGMCSHVISDKMSCDILWYHGIEMSRDIIRTHTMAYIMLSYGDGMFFLWYQSGAFFIATLSMEISWFPNPSSLCVMRGLWYPG